MHTSLSVKEERTLRLSRFIRYPDLKPSISSIPTSRKAGHPIIRLNAFLNVPSPSPLLRGPPPFQISCAEIYLLPSDFEFVFSDSTDRWEGSVTTLATMMAIMAFLDNGCFSRNLLVAVSPIASPAPSL